MSDDRRGADSLPDGTTDTTTGEGLWQLAEQLVPVCERAGRAILAVYEHSEEPEVTIKADASPVTDADYRSHRVLVDGLRSLTPDWPVLSEEETLPPFDVRRHWPRYWLIDPLDGTREFIKRTDEFTVNIALVDHGVPLLGVIAVPCEGVIYAGVPGRRAARWHNGAWTSLAVAEIPAGRVRVMASRRHQSKALSRCCEQLELHFATVETVSAGSALKFCRLAEGRGDIYPRFSPCSEWDTAAGQALLEAAGGRVVDMAFRPLRYNRQRSVASPHFYALAGLGVAWESILAPLEGQ